MANKEFQVRHGLLVNNTVLVANTITTNVGIGRADPSYRLDVVGTVNAASVLTNGVLLTDIANSYARTVGTAGNNYTNTVGAASNTFTVLAYTQANAAALIANTKFSSSGGTVTGDVSIVGTLTVTGNTQLQNVNTLSIGDPLIYLAANNYTSDLVDIGFIANYVNATGSNVHTGLYREHEDKMYYLFQGYDREPANNHIGAFTNNMTLAVLNADIRTSNLVLGGANAILSIKTAFDAANAAPDIANSYARTVGTAGNNYTNTVGAAGNTFTVVAFNQANLAYAQANAAYDKANTGTGGGGATIAIRTDAVSATRYMVFANNTTGNLVTANVTAGLTFNPSSNTLTINGPLFATSKSFVITHPTKEGMTLRYGSLEGPENGVYIRGKSYGNTIELPDYWTGLVHEDSITVHITPFGRQQNLYVWRVANNTVYIEGSDNMSYYYTVYAERKDVDKLIVEY